MKIENIFERNDYPPTLKIDDNIVAVQSKWYSPMVKQALYYIAPRVTKGKNVNEQWFCYHVDTLHFEQLNTNEALTWLSDNRFFNDAQHFARESK